jgi:hypothetical protein
MLCFHIRSPGNITDISVPAFEVLSQYGTAKVTTKNIGTLEASYTLTVCICQKLYTLLHLPSRM